jgi:general secretion pathway protein N
MIARRPLTGMMPVLASATAITVALAANNPPRFDPRDEQVGAPGTPSLGIDSGSAPTAEFPVTGNPLWGIPLKSLSATRERPIFLPSRRPPAPAVAAAPVEPPKPPPPPPAEPERPALRLLGIVSGTTDGFAIFVSDTTRDIIRLKTGEGHEGWILRSVKAREAVLEKNRRSAVIELPPPTGDRK